MPFGILLACMRHYRIMTSFTQPTTPFHPQLTTPHRNRPLPVIRSSFSGEETPTRRRKLILTTILSTSIAAGIQAVSGPLALADQKWGTRSYIWERYFEPGLSPEDAVARIRQTAEGLHGIRDMLETMSWRYVWFFLRLKSAYLDQDLKTAMAIVPEIRRKSYIKTANELVDNMTEFNYFIRTPKVYESYLYYEKTLKSIDDLVALLA